MKNQSISESETSIANMFNSMSKRFDKGDSKGLGKTANKHVEQITKDSTLKTAIDVGSGTGGIMEGLLDKNMSFVYGVDLAPKMIEYAKLRLEKKGYADKSNIENISFLDYSFTNPVDAVSLHSVLCCHPDREKMLEKAISGQPKIIVLTLFRRRLVFRFGMVFLNAFRKVKPGFRPYLHDINKIDQQLEQANYELVDTFNTALSTCRTYKLKH